jgi:hypothetical protein
MSGSEQSSTRVGPGWRYLWIAALVVSPAPALAQLAVTAMADSQYEYNSNVFTIGSGVPGPLGGTRLGDTDFSYGAELDASYLWSQQQFYATVLGNEYRYDHFTELDHSDSSLIAGWDWKVGRIWDGVIDVERLRSMVSFFNVLGDSLVIQTEQRETARVGVQATPDWRAEFTGLTHKIDQPQAGAPNLSLTESQGTAAIKYTGTAGLTAGVDASYLSGSFSDTGLNFDPPYKQVSGGVTATEEVTGLSTFKGLIGYTRRSADDGGRSISGVTGDLDYKRELTGKTKVEVELSRNINIYVASSTSEIDTVAAVNANWQASYKIDVILGYNFTYRQLPAAPEIVNGATVLIGGPQLQRIHTPTLTVTYDPVPWLVLKPYFNYQTRSSTNFPGGNFDATLVGLRFTLQLQHGVIPARVLLN